MKKVVFNGYDSMIYEFVRLQILNDSELEINWILDDTIYTDIINQLTILNDLLAKKFKLSINNYIEWDDVELLLVSTNVDKSNFIQRNSAIQKIVSDAVAKNFSGIILINSNKDYLLINELLKYTGIPSNKILGLGTALETEAVSYLIANKFNVNITEIQISVVGVSNNSIIAWSKGRVAEIPLMSFLAQRRDIFNNNSIEKINEKYLKLTQQTINMLFAKIMIKILSVDFTNSRMISLTHQDFNDDTLIYSAPVLLNNDGAKKLAKINYSENEQSSLNEIFLKIAEEMDKYKLR